MSTATASQQKLDANLPLTDQFWYRLTNRYTTYKSSHSMKKMKNSNLPVGRETKSTQRNCNYYIKASCTCGRKEKWNEDCSSLPEESDHGHARPFCPTKHGTGRWLEMVQVLEDGGLSTCLLVQSIGAHLFTVQSFHLLEQLIFCAVRWCYDLTRESKLHMQGVSQWDTSNTWISLCIHMYLLVIPREQPSLIQTPNT